MSCFFQDVRAFSSIIQRLSCVKNRYFGFLTYTLEARTPFAAPSQMHSQPNLSVDACRLSLAQAVAWCNPRVDPETPATSLRSHELCAALPESAIDGGYWQTLDVVNRLIGLRATLVPHATAPQVHAGRLVCCDVSASVASGGSRLYSDEYFDDFDVPPWDTWVAWFPDRNPVQPDNGYLIAWVPPAFCDLAQRGIDANAAECVFWADDRSESALSSWGFRESVPTWYLNEFAGSGRRT